MLDHTIGHQRLHTHQIAQQVTSDPAAVVVLPGPYCGSAPGYRWQWGHALL